MKSPSISQYIAQFKKTGNPFSIVKALFLLIHQGRMREIAYGICCSIFSPPSVVKPHPHDALQTILDDCQSWISGFRHILSRDDLISIFGKDYAIDCLPADFAGARTESIVYDQDLLIIGEYGHFTKRIAHVTHRSCLINEYYTDNQYVRHIHAIYKARSSKNILVTTGDTAKFLDLWNIENGELRFIRRLRKSLAGYTAITRVGESYYFGTDFSSRPNYIEKLDGRKFFFPKIAYKMDVLAFRLYLDRYLLSINRELGWMGGRRVLSIFDTVTEEFIFCDYLECIKANAANTYKDSVINR